MVDYGPDGDDSLRLPMHMSSISISYTHTSGNQLHPGSNTVILNNDQSAMFQELARVGMPINSSSYWNGSDCTLNDAELLTAGDILDYDNARTLQRCFGAIRRQDWQALKSCFHPDLSFFWQYNNGGTTMVGNNVDEYIEGIKKWRKHHKVDAFYLHRVLVGRSQAFLTWRALRIESSVEGNISTWGDRGYLAKPFCEIVKSRLPEDYPRVSEKQSSSDDLRDNLLAGIADDVKPQYYNYQNGTGTPVSSYSKLVNDHSRVSRVDWDQLVDNSPVNENLVYDPPGVQTTYYTFSSDHLITSLQEMREISGYALLNNHETY